MESVIKCIIAAAAGLFAAIITDEMMGTIYGVTFFGFIVIAIVVSLVCLVGEVILSLSIAGVKRRLWQLPLCIGIVSAIDRKSTRLNSSH